MPIPPIISLILVVYLTQVAGSGSISRYGRLSTDLERI
jgi:hypothetical protein